MSVWSPSKHVGPPDTGQRDHLGEPQPEIHRRIHRLFVASGTQACNLETLYEATDDDGTIGDANLTLGRENYLKVFGKIRYDHSIMSFSGVY